MKLRRVVPLVVAAALAACSGSHGAAPADSGGGGPAGGAGAAGMAAAAGREGPMSGSAGVASAGGSGDAGSRPDASAGDGDGGAPRVDGASARAGGCGMLAAASPQPTGSFVQFQVMTTGATPAGAQPAKAAPRAYWVRLPADYDANRSYRTVFMTGLCATGTERPATFAFFDPSEGGTEEAIYVVIDAGASGMPLRCYDTSAGAESSDFEAFALVHDAVAAHDCVDEDRVFVISLGPSVSNQLGCYFGGTPDPARPFGRTLHVRGQALYDGWGEPTPQPPCRGPVAAIWFDNVQALTPNTTSAASIARVLSQDGCTGTATSPWMSSYPCKLALGCPAGYPVVECAAVFGRTDQQVLTVGMFEAFMEQASPGP